VGDDFNASRGEEPTLRWTWVEEDPAGRKGEYFETPVRELYFAPEMCGSR
jgi:hypothetical protein